MLPCIGWIGDVLLLHGGVHADVPVPAIPDVQVDRVLEDLFNALGTDSDS